MPRSLRTCLLTVAPLALAATAQAQETPRENFDYTGWDQYLGGPDSAQYSALTQITPENVQNLQVVWEFPTGEGNPPQFNPIVVDGTMNRALGQLKKEGVAEFRRGTVYVRDRAKLENFAGFNADYLYGPGGLRVGSELAAPSGAR